MFPLFQLELSPNFAGVLKCRVLANSRKSLGRVRKLFLFPSPSGGRKRSVAGTDVTMGTSSSPYSRCFGFGLSHRFRVQRRGLSRASPRLYRVFTGFLLRVPARALLRLFFFSTAVSKIQGVISVFLTTYNWKSLYKINAIIVFCALD